MSATITSTVAGWEIRHAPEVLGHPLLHRASDHGRIDPPVDGQVELEGDDAVGVRHLDAVVPRAVPLDEAVDALDLERSIGCVAREDVRRDERVAFHQGDCCSPRGAEHELRHLRSGEAAGGTNVVPVPAETCSTPPARR